VKGFFRPLSTQHVGTTILLLSISNIFVIFACYGGDFRQTHDPKFDIFSFLLAW
jgi:uncharacterized protein (DUF486 family)